MSSQPNRATTLERCTKASQGVDKHFANVPEVTIQGVTYKTADIKATFQAAIDSASAADQAKAARSAAVKRARSDKAAALLLLHALYAYVVGTFGTADPGVLADFGFPEPKPRKVSAQTKAKAVQRSAATRAQRGTMGKKQRKQAKAAATPPAPATAAPSAGK